MKWSKLIASKTSLQAASPIADMARLTFYRAMDGELWARPSAEFNDGRFEKLNPPQRSY